MILDLVGFGVVLIWSRSRPRPRTGPGPGLVLVLLLVWSWYWPRSKPAKPKSTTQNQVQFDIAPLPWSKGRGQVQSRPWSKADLGLKPLSDLCLLDFLLSWFRVDFAFGSLPIFGLVSPSLLCSFVVPFSTPIRMCVCACVCMHLHVCVCVRMQVCNLTLAAIGSRLRICK